MRVAQKRTDTFMGNSYMSRVEHERNSRMHKERLASIKPGIDNRAPAPQRHLTDRGRDYAKNKRLATETAYADLKMIQTIATVMTRPLVLPARKGAASLNVESRKQEIFGIMKENHRLVDQIEKQVSVVDNRDMQRQYRQKRRYLINGSHAARQAGLYDDEVCNFRHEDKARFDANQRRGAQQSASAPTLATMTSSSSSAAGSGRRREAVGGKQQAPTHSASRKDPLRPGGSRGAQDLVHEAGNWQPFVAVHAHKGLRGHDKASVPKADRESAIPCLLAEAEEPAVSARGATQDVGSAREGAREKASVSSQSVSPEGPAGHITSQSLRSGSRSRSPGSSRSRSRSRSPGSSRSRSRSRSPGSSSGTMSRSASQMAGIESADVAGVAAAPACDPDSMPAVESAPAPCMDAAGVEEAPLQSLEKDAPSSPTSNADAADNDGAPLQSLETEAQSSPTSDADAAVVDGAPLQSPEKDTQSSPTLNADAAGVDVAPLQSPEKDAQSSPTLNADAAGIDGAPLQSPESDAQSSPTLNADAAGIDGAPLQSPEIGAQSSPTSKADAGGLDKEPLAASVTSPSNHANDAEAASPSADSSQVSPLDRIESHDVPERATGSPPAETSVQSKPQESEAEDDEDYDDDGFDEAESSMNTTKQSDFPSPESDDDDPVSGAEDADASGFESDKG